MSKPLIYVSLDVESNGPIPGPYSMLAFGAVAWSADGTRLASFNANLMPLPDASEDPSTMRWWGQHPAEWQAIRVDLQEPKGAMEGFVNWLLTLGGQVVAICQPKGYDFLWIYWYLRRFAGRCPFGWEALDVRSWIAGSHGIPYTEAIRSKLPAEWFADMRHRHVPLDDAGDIGTMWWKIQGVRKRTQRNPSPGQPMMIPAPPDDAWAVPVDNLPYVQEEAQPETPRMPRIGRAAANPYRLWQNNFRR